MQSYWHYNTSLDFTRPTPSDQASDVRWHYHVWVYDMHAAVKRLSSTSQSAAGHCQQAQFCNFAHAHCRQAHILVPDCCNWCSQKVCRQWLCLPAHDRGSQWSGNAVPRSRLALVSWVYCPKARSIFLLKWAFLSLMKSTSLSAWYLRLRLYVLRLSFLRTQSHVRQRDFVKLHVYPAQITVSFWFAISALSIFRSGLRLSVFCVEPCSIGICHSKALYCFEQSDTMHQNESIQRAAATVQVVFMQCMVISAY